MMRKYRNKNTETDSIEEILKNAKRKEIKVILWKENSSTGS